MFPINDSLVLIIVLVVLYKLTGWFFDRRAERKQREAASKATHELDAAIVAQRRAVAMKPPPPPPVKPAAPTINPDRLWEHIPRISFDLDTQLEFGSSRYHTWYADPEYAKEANIPAGVYITDLRDGPELIGASSQKRIFIPYDQLIQR